MEFTKYSAQKILGNSFIGFFWCMWLTLQYKPQKELLKKTWLGGAKLKYLHFALLCRRNGVVFFRIDRVASEYTYDFYCVEDLTKREKEWFCKKGYAPRKVNTFKLTKENYKDYVSHFDFYHIRNFINDPFVEMFENKLHTYLLLAPFIKNLPNHYAYIEDGENIYRLNYTGVGQLTSNQILEILDKNPLAAKACYGGHGRGFYLLRKTGNAQYQANNEVYDTKGFVNFLGTLKKYVLQDFLTPHHSFVELCGNEAFTVFRVVIINDKIDGPQLMACMARLGCKGAGVLTDFPGTIYCGIDLKTGKMFDPQMFVSDIIREYCPTHPDTGKLLEGYDVVQFEELKQLGLDIAMYMPWIPYITIDVIPAESGLKILEINSHGQTWVWERHFPACKNEYFRKVFLK